MSALDGGVTEEVLTGGGGGEVRDGGHFGLVERWRVVGVRRRGRREGREEEREGRGASSQSLGLKRIKGKEM